MRVIALIALALLTVSASGAAAQTKIDIHRAAKPNVSMRLSGAFASVKVIAWQHDSIAITGAIGAGSRFEGGPLEVSGPLGGMKMFVEASNEASVASNKIEMRVPRGARVWIKAGSADVDVQGVAGGLDLNIVGGSVMVSGKPRELIVESMDGSVSFTGDAAFAKIKTATGHITFVGRGEDMTITTVSGIIAVDGGGRDPIERARLESVTGSITFAADIKRGGDIRFDTHSGAIELRLVPRAEVEIDAATVTGSIENRWNHQRPIAGREGRGMELGTSSGTGGARVQVRSFKGNLRVTTR
jgi:DUF4097 and DUF4098 domain-containing protein YvlB